MSSTTRVVNHTNSNHENQHSLFHNGISDFIEIFSEGTYTYRLCPQCSAHVYNPEGICELCELCEPYDADKMNNDILQKMEEEYQVEYYIGQDLGNDYDNFDDYICDPDQYQ